MRTGTFLVTILNKDDKEDLKYFCKILSYTDLKNIHMVKEDDERQQGTQSRLFHYLHPIRQYLQT